MKKFIFFAPLMVVSLLANCGSKSVDPSKIDLYKKEIMYDDTGKNIFCTISREYNQKQLVNKETTIYQATPKSRDVYEYYYDEHENETRLHLISYDDEEIIFDDWTLTTYVYDKQNRVTTKVDIMSFEHEGWSVFEAYEYEYKDNVKIEKNYGSSGSLNYTTTYTYDEKGNLVNEKTIYNKSGTNLGFTDYEKVYTVDGNKCTTKIESYEILSSGERGELTEVTEITYLNNLWYRPLKKIKAQYLNGQINSYITYESEYDTKNRIKLYKIYDGNEEGTTPCYDYYSTYEY